MTRMRRALDALASGFVVYGLMAACSGKTTLPITGMGTGGAAASSGHTGGGGHEGATASSGHGGSGGQPASEDDSGIFDALTDPVAEAMAGIENPQSGTRLKGKYLMGADGSKQYQLTTTLGVYGNPNGPLAVEAVWYDSMLQEDCTFLQASDGKLRCLPGVLALTFQQLNGFLVVFTDAKCTMPLVVQYQPPTGCLPWRTPKYVQSQYITSNSCGAPTTRVFQVGDPAVAPTMVYQSAQGTCGTGFNPAQAGTIMEYFSATEPDPSAFVEGTTGVDP